MANVPPDLSGFFDRNIRGQQGRPYKRKEDVAAAEAKQKSQQDRRFKKVFDPYSGQESSVPRETTSLYDAEGNIVNENIDYVNEPVDFTSLPNAFSKIPTNTTAYDANSTKPGQPRTVAAAYDPIEKRLTVMFLDSTLYNYEGVTMSEWDTFKDHRSPGEYIYYTLNDKQRGRADDINLDEQDLARAQMLAATAQKRVARKAGKKPKGPGTGAKSKKPASFKPAPVWNPNQYGELK